MKTLGEDRPTIWHFRCAKIDLLSHHQRRQKSAERRKRPTAVSRKNQSNGLLSVRNPNGSGDESIFDDVIEQRWYMRNKHGSGLFILEFWARRWYCMYR